MPVLTDDLVRQLASHRSAQAPITSCYLDIDGRRHVHLHDVEVELDRLLRQARARLNGDRSVSVDRDLRRIERHVKGGLDRSGVRGLAMFSCADEGLWEVLELPVPVRSQIVVSPTPYVRQLEALISNYERFGVLVADRQRARMFVFELGQLVDKKELFDALPRHDDDRGDWEKDHVRDHAEEAAAAHLRHTAAAALHVLQETGFEHLIVGAPEDITHRLEKALHPYLRERLVARLPVTASASEDEIRTAALAVEADVERRRQGELVDRLRETAGSGGPAAVGLDATLPAVVDSRVATLLVSRGFDQAGWRCGSCGHLALVGPKCGRCGGPSDRTDDIVEVAIEGVLGQGGRVVVCDGNADLDVLGRIGALLRY